MIETFISSALFKLSASRLCDCARKANLSYYIFLLFEKGQERQRIRILHIKVRISRGGGTGEASEATASPEFRGFTTEKFLAS